MPNLFRLNGFFLACFATVMLSGCVNYGEFQRFQQLNYGYGYYTGYSVKAVTTEGTNRHVIYYLGGTMATGRNWLDFYTLVGAFETGQRLGFQCMDVRWKGGYQPLQLADGPPTAWRTIEYRTEPCLSNPAQKVYAISDLPQILRQGVRTVDIEASQTWD
ncbi:hypothetical protein NT239_01665 [Chitinibacter sp. SCUT-21]|uniref:hypothetical protein n=1 Tax=Chitinibacter sp. SCUT-21 TaxID=2970891 RepID=UPI0035A6A75C